MIATIAEKKFSGRSDHMETTLHSYRIDSKSTKMHCVRSRFSRCCQLACENIRFSSLFAAGDVSRGGTSAAEIPYWWRKSMFT